MTARYNRHNLIDWFSQEGLARAKVAVIGAGAVGNEVIKNLALLGVGEVHIFDCDTIEVHNLTRSVLFREADVGRSKAEVAARRAMEMDPNIKAIPKHGDFWDRLSISELRTFSVLFCCVDNFEARLRCNTLCYLAQVDFINLGIDSRSASVEVFPFGRSQEHGCLECTLPDSVYRRISERYSCGQLRKLSYIEKKVPTTIITSSVAAGFAVSTGLRLGSDGDAVPTNTRLFFDTITSNMTRTSLGRNAQCPCCGRMSGVPILISCKDAVDNIPTEIGLDATVTTSEPILVGYRSGSGSEFLVFQRASAFDDSFPATVSDDPGSVQLEVRDQFTLTEISTRFAGRRMPCKFAILSAQDKNIVCEFIRKDHE
jgi:molybdopterin/thiamine biosynthesis adenylyltransferase